jgi:putative ABC transport system permease protein
LRGRITHVNGIPAEEAIVDQNEDWVIRSDRAFTYLAKQPPHGQIVEGKWWPENYSGDPAVSISMDVKRAFDIGVGDKLTINIMGQDITASVMNVREIEWTSFTMNYAVTFAPGTLEGAPATYLATAVTAPDNELNLQNKIAASFPNVTSIRVKEAMETAQGIIRAVSEAVSVSAAVTLLAGILVLSASVAAARQRHIYDSVILKVLGATRRRILATFLLEYALLGMMTVVLAGGLGTLASLAVMKHILDLPWVFGWQPLLATTALCLFVTVAAGFAGTWRVLGQRPAVHLRN